MFSPNFRVHRQENGDIVARKPGLSSSVRKPFEDRSVNEKPSSNPLQFKQPLLTKTQPEVTKLPQPDYPDWLMDTFSSKDVNDNYGDILPPSGFITKGKIHEMLRRCTTYSEPKTPPLKFVDDFDNLFLKLLKNEAITPTRCDEPIFATDDIEDVLMPTIDFNDFAI